MPNATCCTRSAGQGRFVNGVGTFYSDGDINGKPVRTRYTWSQITKTSARWEQAYRMTRQNLGYELGD
jgi:hypothetical protein